MDEWIIPLVLFFGIIFWDFCNFLNYKKTLNKIYKRTSEDVTWNREK